MFLDGVVVGRVLCVLMGYGCCLVLAVGVGDDGVCRAYDGAAGNRAGITGCDVWDEYRGVSLGCECGLVWLRVGI